MTSALKRTDRKGMQPTTY